VTQQYPADCMLTTMTTLSCLTSNENISAKFIHGFGHLLVRKLLYIYTHVHLCQLSVASSGVVKSSTSRNWLG